MNGACSATSTPHLVWMLLTKRPQNILRMVPSRWKTIWPQNVWGGITVENRICAQKRIPHLLRVPSPVRFLSCEPLLEDLGQIELSGIDWVIIGGESGSLAKARPFVLEHARALKEQCDRAGVNVFVKQFGRHPTLAGTRVKLRDNKGEDQQEWPEDLRVQEYPQYLAGTGFPVIVRAPASSEPELFTGEAR
jgi:protein gp37